MGFMVSAAGAAIGVAEALQAVAMTVRAVALLVAECAAALPVAVPLVAECAVALQAVAQDLVKEDCGGPVTNDRRTGVGLDEGRLE